MDEFFFSLPMSDSKSLCIGPITHKEAESLFDSSLGDGTGFYIFIADTINQNEEIVVLGKLDSYEQAALFVGMLRKKKALAIAA